jgi:hypothetical protein
MLPLPNDEYARTIYAPSSLSDEISRSASSITIQVGDTTIDFYETFRLQSTCNAHAALSSATTAAAAVTVSILHLCGL